MVSGPRPAHPWGRPANVRMPRASGPSVKSRPGVLTSRQVFLCFETLLILRSLIGSFVEIAHEELLAHTTLLEGDWKLSVIQRVLGTCPVLLVTCLWVYCALWQAVGSPHVGETSVERIRGRKHLLCEGVWVIIFTWAEVLRRD